MVKLQATLLAQSNSFLDQFIKYNGISHLLNVHEDLFWRFGSSPLLSCVTATISLTNVVPRRGVVQNV
jgi:hypothetical protein